MPDLCYVMQKPHNDFYERKSLCGLIMTERAYAKTPGNADYGRDLRVDVKKAGSAMSSEIIASSSAQAP